ncbi:MAG: UTP--glucose-1-phosphate uridylyltransferase [Elusimicrobiota bacterium]
MKNKYPELDSFFEYIRLNYSINPIYLILEEKVVTEDILLCSAEKLVDRELLFLSTMGEHLKSFISLKMTYDDFKYFDKNVDKFKKVLNKYFQNSETDEVVKLLDEAEIYKFYKANIDRDKIFCDVLSKEVGRPKTENKTITSCQLPDVSSQPSTSNSSDNSNSNNNDSQFSYSYSNILSHLNEFKEINIVVAGGFHSNIAGVAGETVQDLGLLVDRRSSATNRQQQVRDSKFLPTTSYPSYLTIVPNATKGYDETVYEKIMTGTNLTEFAKSALAPLFIGAFGFNNSAEVKNDPRFVKIIEAMVVNLGFDEALDITKNIGRVTIGKNDDYILEVVIDGKTILTFEKDSKGEINLSSVKTEGKDTEFDEKDKVGQQKDSTQASGTKGTTLRSSNLFGLVLLWAIAAQTESVLLGAGVIVYLGYILYKKLTKSGSDEQISEEKRAKLEAQVGRFGRDWSMAAVVFYTTAAIIIFYLLFGGGSSVSAAELSGIKDTLGSQMSDGLLSDSIIGGLIAGIITLLIYLTKFFAPNSTDEKGKPISQKSEKEEALKQTLIKLCSSQGLTKLKENLEAGVIKDEKHLEMVELLLDLNQGHLFLKWDNPRVNGDRKIKFLEQVYRLNNGYPNGIRGYWNSAKRLVIEAKEGKNPFEGMTPKIPTMIQISEELDDKESNRIENIGLKEINKAGFVLVAGGVGDRLGYPGIKISIPVEMVTYSSYLKGYIESILALQNKSNKLNNENRKIPLVIMTSDDTDRMTRGFLEKNNNFGMNANQITIIKQDNVAAINSIDGDFVCEEGDVYTLQTKPHGHGDVHMLLHKNGIMNKWIEDGQKYTMFIQDTNAQSFNGVLSALGVSVEKKFDFNFITVPRSAGEAAGAIVNLVNPDGTETTENVEYNELGLLLKASFGTVDVSDSQTGNSPFPGNLNVFIISNDAYSEILNRTQGVIGEFVNPKLNEDGTFKKPTRLETMMQKIASKFSPEKVGVTNFVDKRRVFSPTKNPPTEGASKRDTMVSSESDFYQNFRKLFSAIGVVIDVDGEEKVTKYGEKYRSGAKIVIKPSFAQTYEELKNKFSGGEISCKSTLVIDGENVTVGNLNLDGTLIIRVGHGVYLNISNLSVENAGWHLVDLTEDELKDINIPAEIRMRGHKLVKKDQLIIEIDKPGYYEVDDNGVPYKISKTQVTKIAAEFLPTIKMLKDKGNMDELISVVHKMGSMLPENVDQYKSISVIDNMDKTTDEVKVVLVTKNEIPGRQGFVLNTDAVGILEQNLIKKGFVSKEFLDNLKKEGIKTIIVQVCDEFEMKKNLKLKTELGLTGTAIHGDKYEKPTRHELIMMGMLLYNNGQTEADANDLGMFVAVLTELGVVVKGEIDITDLMTKPEKREVEFIKLKRRFNESLTPRELNKVFLLPILQWAKITASGWKNILFLSWDMFKNSIKGFFTQKWFELAVKKNRETIENDIKKSLKLLDIKEYEKLQLEGVSECIFFGKKIEYEWILYKDIKGDKEIEETQARFNKIKGVCINFATSIVKVGGTRTLLMVRRKTTPLNSISEKNQIKGVLEVSKELALHKMYVYFKGEGAWQQYFGVKKDGTVVLIDPIKAREVSEKDKNLSLSVILGLPDSIKPYKSEIVKHWGGGKNPLDLLFYRTFELIKKSKKEEEDLFKMTRITLSQQ